VISGRLGAAAVTVGFAAHVVHVHIAFVVQARQEFGHRRMHGGDIARLFVAGVGLVGDLDVEEVGVLAAG